MSKKLTAVLLTLCLALGLLPMAAFAAPGDKYVKDGDTSVIYVEGQTSETTGGTTFTITPGTDTDTYFYYEYTDKWYTDSTHTTEVKLVKVDNNDAGGTQEQGSTTVTAEVTEDKVKNTSGNDVIIEVTGGDNTTTGAEVTIKSGAMEKVANKNVTVQTKAGNITLPAAITEKYKGADVALQVAPKAEKPAVIASAKTAKVVDVSMFTVAGDQKTDVGQALGGSVTVSLNIGKSITDPRLYYVNGTALELIKDAVFDAQTGILTWTTSHLCDWAYMSLADAADAGLDTGAVATPAQPLPGNKSGMGMTYTVNPGQGEDVIYQVTFRGINSITLVKDPGKPVAINVDENATVVAWTAKGIAWSTDAGSNYFTHETTPTKYDSTVTTSSAS